MSLCHNPKCNKDCDSIGQASCLRYMTKEQYQTLQEIRKAERIKCKYYLDKHHYLPAEVNMYTGELVIDGQARRWGA